MTDRNAEQAAGGTELHFPDAAKRRFGWPRVWTHEEILAEGVTLDHGWFHGVVAWDGRLWVGEIFPGRGFTDRWPHWQNWPRFVHDLFTMRATFPGLLTEEPAARMRARHAAEDAQMERVMELGKTCKHERVRPFLEDIPDSGQWCPDCWLWIRDDKEPVA